MHDHLGNVVTNVLLALLSDSVLAGLVAFVFSTIVITIFLAKLFRKRIFHATLCEWHPGSNPC